MQVAPFDDFYQFDNASNAVTQYDTSLTKWNSYLGGPYQQAVSSLTYIDDANYNGTSGGFGVYGKLRIDLVVCFADEPEGFEYYSNPNDRSGGHITWVANGVESWTLLPAAVGPNPRSQVSQRLITEEPMAMVSQDDLVCDKTFVLTAHRL